MFNGGLTELVHATPCDHPLVPSSFLLVAMASNNLLVNGQWPNCFHAGSTRKGTMDGVPYTKLGTFRA